MGTLTVNFFFTLTIQFSFHFRSIFQFKYNIWNSSLILTFLEAKIFLHSCLPNPYPLPPPPLHSIPFPSKSLRCFADAFSPIFRLSLLFRFFLGGRGRFLFPHPFRDHYNDFNSSPATSFTSPLPLPLPRHSPSSTSLNCSSKVNCL